MKKVMIGMLGAALLADGVIPELRRQREYKDIVAMVEDMGGEPPSTAEGESTVPAGAGAVRTTSSK